MKVVFWWCMPCRSISPVCRELSLLANVNVTFIAAEDIFEQRKRLGWEMPDFGATKLSVLPADDWKNAVGEIIKTEADAIHIFNGVYYFRKLHYALGLVQEKGLRMGVISEAPHNPYFGMKRYLKHCFTSYVTPVRVKRRAKKAMFVLSASGRQSNASLEHIGWPPEKIFPFGYFTEAPEVKVDKAGRTTRRSDNNETKLLCSGYITLNKGQRVLVRALSLLRTKGYKLRCTIVGFGPDGKRLRELISSLALDDIVDLVGVVEDSELAGIKANSDLFIAPGYEEPWGIRVNEALQAGIPVIVGDGVGASEMIADGATGYVFRRGDSHDLAKCIEYFLEDSARLAAAKQKAFEFGELIHPRHAAQYLMDVVQYCTGTSSARPQVPVWFVRKFSTRE